MWNTAILLALEGGGLKLDQAGMRISIPKFKYLWVLFMSKGRLEREIDKRIGAVSAVMQSTSLLSPMFMGSE